MGFAALQDGFDLVEDSQGGVLALLVANLAGALDDVAKGDPVARTELKGHLQQQARVGVDPSLAFKDAQETAGLMPVLL